MICPKSTIGSKLRVVWRKKWLASTKIFELKVGQKVVMESSRMARTYSIKTVLSPHPQSPCRIPGTRPRGLTSNKAWGFLYGSTSMYWYCKPLASMAIQTRCTNGLMGTVSKFHGIDTDVTGCSRRSPTCTHQKQLPNNFNS